MKVAIVGCGGLGSSLAKGLAKAGKEEFQLILCDHDQEKAKALTGECAGKARYAMSVSDASKEADVIIVSVKPYDVKDVSIEIGKSMNDKALVVSCATGVPLLALETFIGKKVAVARAMPNTAVSALASTTGVFLGTQCEPQRDKQRLQSIFGNLGSVRSVNAEEDLHAVTALSGSGPAFVLLMLEAMIDAGVRAGLSRNDSEFFAKGAFKAASELVSQSSKSVYDLKGQITSPAGTTIEGIFALEQGGFRHAVMEAIESAHIRSVELSDYDLDSDA